MDFKQQFKEYYEKKLQEDLAVAQQSAAEQSYQTQAMNSSLDSVVLKYVGNGDIKEGLKQLATDLGTAIYNYVISDKYVQDELFNAPDDKAKYVNLMTQKIQQGACTTLVDLLRHMAVDISNAKNTITK
jgi:hypothetical protein